MTKFPLILHTQPQAPAKPALGAACNGCGVCCLLEPCPLGVVLSGSRIGACVALRWDEAQKLYRCGAMTDPLAVVQARLADRLAFAAPVLARALPCVAPRWVAAGVGCDCSVQVLASPTDDAHGSA